MVKWIVAILLLIGLTYSISISSCQNLSVAGSTYTLTANVSSVLNSNCFNVTTNNIVLNCQGFNITGRGTAPVYGIYAQNKQGINITGCNIHNFSAGIYYDNVNNSQIYLTNVSNPYAYSSPTGQAIFLYYAKNVSLLFSNLIAVNGATAIHLQWSPNSTLTSNMISGDTFNGALYNENSYDNNYTNNTFSTVSGQALEIQGATYVNITNNTIKGNNGQGLVFITSNNNIVKQNLFANGTKRLVFGGTGNIVYWNNFTNESPATSYVEDTSGSNYYNLTEGNLWGGMDGRNLTGLVASSYLPSFRIATGGFNYPYNNTRTGGKFVCSFTGCGDYAPLFTDYLFLSYVVNYTINQSDIVSYRHNISLPNMTAADYAVATANVSINGTLYQAQSMLNGSVLQFIVYAIPPIQTNITNNSYNVTWDISLPTIPYSFSTSYNITVHYSGAAQCNTSFTFPVANFTFKNEINLTAIYVNGQLTVMANADRQKNFSGNFSAKLFYDVCQIANETFNLTTMETYTNNSYNQRNYYVQNETIPKNYTRYLGTTADTSLVTFTIYDAAGRELDGGTIKVYRYYPANNSLLEIADAQISEGGQANAWLTYSDVTYQFEVWQNYELKKVFAFQTLPCYVGSTCAISLNLQGSATGEFLTYRQSTATNCNLDNVTGIVSCNITDSSKRLGLINLSIWNSTINQTTLIATNTTTYPNATTTLTAYVGPTTGQTYFVQLTGQYGTETMPLLQQGYDFAHGALFGMVGVFIAYILIIALSGAGAVTGPSGSAIGAAIGLAGSWGLRLIEIDVTSVVFATIMAIVLAWILKA